MIPSDWLPAANAKRIIIHWTAGSYTASSLDREHYHFLIEGDGKVVRGKHAVTVNDNTQDGEYARHTLSLNTNSIGVALCAMAGATERPFSTGKYPITQSQWSALAKLLRQLCDRYSIPVLPRTVLTHAEVEPVLGVAQRKKWDVTATPEDSPMRLRSPQYVGDQIRRNVQALTEKPEPTDQKIVLHAGATITLALPSDKLPAVHFDPTTREITVTA